MKDSSTSTSLQTDTTMYSDRHDEYIRRKAIITLLRIKDADTRITILEQARDAVDKSVHIGGAFSSVIPAVTLYYGGILRYNVVEPTALNQDMFILSKGHAVATMAAIYADVGYFDSSVLKNSRSYESILNGHPGPILPGAHISTGPMGQGLSVAQGMALAGRIDRDFDVFCITGDGELQEGNIWEGIMYSGAQHLENFCVIVDHNRGQLDDVKRLHIPPVDLAAQIRSFGWNAVAVDGTQYGTVLDALEQFKYGARNGKPTAVVSVTNKGFGGCSDCMMGHKVTIPDEQIEQEISLQKKTRDYYVSELQRTISEITSFGGESKIIAEILDRAKKMRLTVDDNNGNSSFSPVKPVVLTRRAAPRDKKIRYNASELPKLDPKSKPMISDVIRDAMKVFAKDPKIVSIDSDLATTSGLQPGVGFVDIRRALNVGIAEANMMCIGEGFASVGYNTWVSTFCPFFNFNVIRRIAISHQERLEAIEMKNGWLSEGHGLDLVFVATAPNFETKTNGATHMGNDDIMFFSEIAHLKMIDFSCPNQFLGFMKWVMEGNKGLIYARIMRSGSPILYKDDVTFEYGKGYVLHEADNPDVVFVSSGRQVHECLEAAAQLEKQGTSVKVIDMPSADEKLFLELAKGGSLIVFAEQNNGYLYSRFQRTLFDNKQTVDMNKVLAINTLGPDRKPHFIHSGMYEELIGAFNLAPGQLVTNVKGRV